MLDDATNAKMKIEMTRGSAQSDTSLNDQREIRESRVSFSYMRQRLKPDATQIRCYTLLLAYFSRFYHNNFSKIVLLIS